MWVFTSSYVCVDIFIFEDYTRVANTTQTHTETHTCTHTQTHTRTRIYAQLTHTHTHIYTQTYKTHTQMQALRVLYAIGKYDIPVFFDAWEGYTHERVSLLHTATHCKTLQHTATHCNTLQSHCNYTAAHCDTLQHTATHCNTLQHTATLPYQLFLTHGKAAPTI